MPSMLGGGGGVTIRHGIPNLSEGTFGVRDRAVMIITAEIFRKRERVEVLHSVLLLGT